MERTVPVYGTHSSSLWGTAFHPLKLTVPSIETHSSKRWNSQFQALEFYGNTLTEILLTVIGVLESSFFHHAIGIGRYVLRVSAGKQPVS